MNNLNSRVISDFSPFRKVVSRSTKFVFLSLEGAVTEEQYFKRVMELYPEKRSKIKFISVMEDIVSKKDKFRSEEERKRMGKTRFKQLVDRIEVFKQEKNDEYEFDKYSNDEFWVVSDVDDNWSSKPATPSDEKTRIDEWNEGIKICDTKKYSYAISNPFFEAWLLLHHDEPTEEDKKYAVTSTHDYEKTSHFRERLDTLGAPMTNKKHINAEDYTLENIQIAVERAKVLHVNKNDLQPKYFASTVYLLLEKIINMK